MVQSWPFGGSGTRLVGEAGAVTRATVRDSIRAVFCVLAFAMAHEPLDALAFRTGGETPELEGTSRVRFSDPITFQLNTNLPENLQRWEVERELLAAADEWSTPECTSVEFQYVGPTDRPAMLGDGFNTIEWVDDFASLTGVGDAAAYTDLLYVRSTAGHWAIEEADLYLDRSARWSITLEDGSTDVYSALLHELGHVLGLLHPCELEPQGDVPRCVGDKFTGIAMHPAYAGGTRLVLSADDVHGVCFLYPSRESCDELGCPSGTQCVAGNCVETCRDAACDDDEVCTAIGCQPSYECENASCVQSECLEDRNCALGEHCRSRRCVRGALQVGDPCRDDEECFHGVCRESRCAIACQTDNDCSNADCLEGGDGTLACDEPLLHLGMECDAPGDCAGQHCLTGAGDTPVCTRSCAEAPCPDGWKCGVVAEVHVCVPAATTVAGGCTTAESASRTSSMPQLLSAVLIGMMTWGRCRSGRSRRR